jgi:hypothetical protein
MEPKDQKMYDNFFELWNEKYSELPDWIKEVALAAWVAAIDGQTLDAWSDEEIIAELSSRGYDVEETTSSDEYDNEYMGYG